MLHAGLRTVLQGVHNAGLQMLVKVSSLEDPRSGSPGVPAVLDDEAGPGDKGVQL